MNVQPDYTTAALKAAETLIKYEISTAPIDPLPILKKQPGIVVIPFAEMAFETGVDRDSIVASFGESQDAASLFKMVNGQMRYIVAYNQRLPFYILQRALSRELGHIMLHHDGTRPESVRMEEAMCFARNLICPRPLIKMIQESGIRLTTEVLGNLTGCYERCLAGLRKTPGVVIPGDINRTIRKQFETYVKDFVSFQGILARDDQTHEADFGTYMDGYTEEECKNDEV